MSFVVMIEEVLPSEDMPTAVMYAFCLLSGWYITRWMILNHASRCQTVAAAKKMEDLKSHSLRDAASETSVDRKKTRRAGASRKRAKGAPHKAATPAAVSKKNVLDADDSAGLTNTAEEVHDSVRSDTEDNSVHALYCGGSAVSLIEMNVETENAQIAMDDEQSSISTNFEIEIDMTRHLMAMKTVLLKPPRTQVDKDCLRYENKLRGVESLKQKLSQGQKLEKNQLNKFSVEASFREQMLAVTEADLKQPPESCQTWSSDDPLTSASGQDVSDDMDGSSTRSSDDMQSSTQKLDWNDPFWESSEPPSLRFSCVLDPEEEDGEEEQTRMQKEKVTELHGEALSNGSVYMPVGFLNQNHEYFPFDPSMEIPATQTDVFLEPAILQKVVINPSVLEPVTHDVASEPSVYDVVEDWNRAWHPVCVHSDWESLGERRGVQPTKSSNTWRSSFSRDNWETKKKHTRQQYYEKGFSSPYDCLENQGRRWDEPWGM